VTEKRWCASQYLDDDRWGVLSDDGEIIVGLREGKTREECERIAAVHNRWLDAS